MTTSPVRGASTICRCRCRCRRGQAVEEDEVARLELVARRRGRRSRTARRRSGGADAELGVDVHHEPGAVEARVGRGAAPLVGDAEVVERDRGGLRVAGGERRRRAAPGAVAGSPPRSSSSRRRSCRWSWSPPPRRRGSRGRRRSVVVVCGGWRRRPWPVRRRGGAWAEPGQRLRVREPGAGRGGSAWLARRLRLDRARSATGSRRAGCRRCASIPLIRLRSAASA